MATVIRTEKIYFENGEIVDPEEGEEALHDDPIEIHYWVATDEEEDAIGLDAISAQTDWSPDLAWEIARLIQRLCRWARSKSGRTKIAALRKQLRDDEREVEGSTVSSEGEQ